MPGEGTAGRALRDLVAEGVRAGETVLTRVRGTSMLPLLPPGTECAVQTARPEDLRIGEVVCFRTDADLVVHRLVARVPGGSDGSTMFLCKGDNLSTFDPPFGTEALVGRVVEAGGRELSPSPWGARLSRLQGTLHVWVLATPWARRLGDWKMRTLWRGSLLRAIAGRLAARARHAPTKGQ